MLIQIFVSYLLKELGLFPQDVLRVWGCQVQWSLHWRVRMWRGSETLQDSGRGGDWGGRVSVAGGFSVTQLTAHGPGVGRWAWCLQDRRPPGAADLSSLRSTWSRPPAAPTAAPSPPSRWWWASTTLRTPLATGTASQRSLTTRASISPLASSIFPSWP